jgi:hypothetical protein
MGKVCLAGPDGAAERLTLKPMKPEKQRIAIAEYCGYVMREDGHFRRADMTVGSCGIPDYLNSLDAMHEAEMTIANDDRFSRYEFNLDRVVPMNERWIFATAEQRAEAFLRTVGRWEK